MPRSLLALCILFFASSAMANNVAAGSETSVKPGKATAVSNTQDGEAPTVTQPSTPVRTSAPRTSAARWHSMLPGMIR